MFKRELKVNFKTWLIWTSVMILLYVTVIAIYPSLFTSESISALDEMMKIFPDSMLKAFNMDVTSIATASGWFKTEGAMFYLLVGALYAAILGSGILLKEESDKTIEFLYARPVSRNRILTEKFFAGLIYVTAFALVVTGSVLAGLAVIGDKGIGDMPVIMLTPAVMTYVVYAACFFFSTFMRKTKKTVGLSFAVVFGSYFLQMISTLSDKYDFLKYFSVFTICDTRSIIESGAPNTAAMIVASVLFILFAALSYIRYNKKELV